ncbi:MAG: carboxylating nicotinate-nucleotide diphosphorylase [Actinomycetota bacterium]|nr:carboxylating nicotinate-nucleotide diphosphorylase [Actinomycetota bacterium]
MAEIDIAEAALGIIRIALAEDLGDKGDITADAIFHSTRNSEGAVFCNEPCVLAGQPVACKVFELTGAHYEALLRDGERISAGEKIASVEGNIKGILAGERTALNFLSHMSGVATLTYRLVEAAKPYDVRILDTRKTLPGLRVLEKYGVEKGGGTNHRMGLFDGIIIKDNHIRACGGIAEATRRVRTAYGDMYRIEVEASTILEVQEALDSKVDIIMLDNMDDKTIEKAVSIVRGKVAIEVSGGVKPENILGFVKLGMDSISLGYITNSAKAIDFTLELT